MFDILAQRTCRKSLNELQKRELRKNIVSDFVDYFYIRKRVYLWLISIFRPSVDSFLFGFLVYPNIKYYACWVIVLPHYQPLLDLFYKDIKKVLDRHGIEVELNGIDDVGRWSIMNADYISTFGMDSRISVNSGMIYFLHVFCRNLQPFLMRDKTPKRVEKMILRLMKRQFKRSAIAFCTNNHRKIIRMVSMVPVDGTLLEGMEMFVLYHEIGHAFFTQHGEGAWPFKKERNQVQMNRMKNDEEYASDIFSINMLMLMYDSQKGKYLLYGACLLFLILSWFEESGFIKKPVKHPSSKDRYYYLLEEIKEVNKELNDHCLEYSIIVNKLWQSCKDDVGKGIEKYRKNRAKYEDSLDVVREFARHYFRCEELGEN